MRHQLKVLLVGRPGPTLSQLEGLLSYHRQLQVTVSPVVDGAAPSLTDLKDPCDVILLLVEEDWQSLLAACFKRDAPASKPLLVVGPAGDMALMRTTMRLGGRDYFSLPVGAEDLVAALDRLAKEEHEHHGNLSARVTTFMNAKGGSGASFCAANYAHILASARSRSTVLLDFDLQFGNLPTYFNLQSRNGLVQALDQVDTLDAAALPGYTQVHSSGLHLLASATEDVVLPEDINEGRVGKLFAVLDKTYQELVIDLPRHIDRATVAVLDRSDMVILVVQQLVTHLQEVKRVASLLGGPLGIAADRLIVLINRFHKQGEVTLEDFVGALPGLRIETLPNDYANVSKSVNLGTPLLELAPRSPLCTALQDLVDSLMTGQPVPDRRPRDPWAWLSGGRR
ncbi:AAA family ATPase [uncultured Thiodictyon sp.]|uniref:AAA family ATPase n=1 Tax=uncultured Thiodictyon sp. TaxID=1846217 RepID=UPI0025E793E0|nr:AAA family ATPase [uncultured Thiodictyon sp.]